MDFARGLLDFSYGLVAIPRIPTWSLLNSMEFWRVWVIGGMGYERVDCNMHSGCAVFFLTLMTALNLKRKRQRETGSRKVRLQLHISLNLPIIYLERYADSRTGTNPVVLVSDPTSRFRTILRKP